MAPLTPGQRALQERFESLIGAAAPLLDIVLAVGERISRIAEPTDHEYYPVRPDDRPELPAPLRADGEAVGGAGAEAGHEAGGAPAGEPEGGAQPER
jgi:hypothetical protein